MHKDLPSIGIIGFGSFGKFLAEKLSSYARVMVYSPSGTACSWSASLQDVARAEYIIPAIPLESYETMLGEIKPLLSTKAVIVDVCSVKEKPIQILKSVLPNQPIVATHPMFGPESASASFDGHTLVMCAEDSFTDAYECIKSFATSIGLKVVEVSAIEHDKEIAIVQGLTFYIARSLKNMDIENQLLHTPSFQRLLNLVALEQDHSQQLFETIQLGNKYTAKVRSDFLAAALSINESLHK